MNNKTGTIVAVSLIVVALVTSSYSLGWVNFGSDDRVIPLAPPIGEKREGSPPLGDRESIDSDDVDRFNLRDSIESVIPDDDDGVKGGSRKRRRINSKKQSKKRSNKRSKSTKKRHNSRQISKKKK